MYPASPDSGNYASASLLTQASMEHNFQRNSKKINIYTCATVHILQKKPTNRFLSWEICYMCTYN